MDVVAGKKTRCVTKADTLTQNGSAPVEKQMARPSIFTEDLAAEICKRLSSGQSLRKICSENDMPNISTVMDWLQRNETFSAQYTRAREAQAETLADQIVDLVDEEDDPAKARVRMDARKWFASKVAPKKYGDKIAQEVTGNMALTVITGVPRANG